MIVFYIPKQLHIFGCIVIINNHRYLLRTYSFYIISFDFLMCINWILLLPLANRWENDYDSESESEVSQLCPTLCDPMDRSIPGSSIHGIFQARVLEWVAVSFSRGYSRPRNRMQVSCIVGRCFTVWATREVMKMNGIKNQLYNVICHSWWFTHLIPLTLQRFYENFLFPPFMGEESYKWLNFSCLAWHC